MKGSVLSDQHVCNLFKYKGSDKIQTFLGKEQSNTKKNATFAVYCASKSANV